MAATVQTYTYMTATPPNLPALAMGNTQDTNKACASPTKACASPTAGMRYHIAWTLMIWSFRYRRVYNKLKKI